MPIHNECKIWGFHGGDMSFWLQLQGPGFHSRRYQIFWVAVGQECGPLRLVRINEELLEGQVAAPV
jgi:hypothetical protein